MRELHNSTQEIIIWNTKQKESLHSTYHMYARISEVLLYTHSKVIL